MLDLLGRFSTAFDASSASIVLKNCQGDLLPDFKGSATPQEEVEVDGGSVALTFPYSATPLASQVKVSLRNNATLRFDSQNQQQISQLSTAIVVATNSTVSLFSQYYSSSYYRLTGSITYNDNTGYLYLMSPDSAISMTGALRLNNTRLIYDTTRNPYYYQAKLLVARFAGPLVGQFNPQLIFRHSGYRYELASSDLIYTPSEVYIETVYQEWPAIGWGVFPIILLIAAAFVTPMVLCGKMCGRKAGDMDDVDWLGRPASVQFAAVRNPAYSTA